MNKLNNISSNRGFNTKSKAWQSFTESVKKQNNNSENKDSNFSSKNHASNLFNVMYAI